MKTLFVSIGSTSTWALANLIDRLIDLDIYKSDKTYEDVFVGIDTAPDPLDNLERYNTGEVAHTHVISFHNSAGNVKSHDFLHNSFRRDWDRDDMEIRASERGVGGKRVKSFSTLEWTRRLNELIDEFFNGVNEDDRLNECQVVLVTSAWGGTATGMFQNIADFIGAKLFSICGGSNKLTPFYVFIAMPDFSATKSVFKDNNYQGAENFVYMMRGIQQTGWRGALNKGRGKDKDAEKGAGRGKERSPFLFPEFFDFPLDGENWLPVVADGERLRGTTSVLAAKAVIVIPSLLPAATTSTIAEELLLFVYLDILDRNLVLSSKNSAKDKFIDLRGETYDNVVIGINMVECQLEYDAELRKVVAQRLHDSWKRFTSEGRSNQATQFVRNFIAQLIRKPQEDRLQKNVVPLLDNLTSSNPKDLNDLKESIDGFRNAAQNDYYSFVVFGNDLFKKMDEYAKLLDERDPLRQAFYNDLVLKDVQQAYQEQVNTWLEAAKVDEEEKSAKIKRMIDRAASTYQQLRSRNGRNSYIVGYCNGVDEVPKEYNAIAREEIKNELQELQKLMLVKATIKRFRLGASSADLSADWKPVADLIEKKLNDGNAPVVGSSYTFVKKVADPRLPKLLADFDLIHIKSSNLIDLIECFDDQAKLNNAYNRVCDDFIREVKMVIADPNRYVAADDFSMVTLANADNVKCCSMAYQIAGTDNIPPQMFHFYAKCAGSGDITWNDVKNLGFDSFLRCKKTSVVRDKKVEDSDLESSGNVGCGVWFDDKVSYDNSRKLIKLYGMWLGSVNLSMRFSDVFKKSYAADQLVNIQSDARTHEETGKVQCLNTLFERIVISSVLGILNRKLADKKPNDQQKLAVSVRISDDIRWSAQCLGKAVGELGFQSEADGCSIKAVSADFIKTLMEWMRKNGNGSCRLADALGPDCQELFRNLMDQDRYVLQKMSLVPDAEQWALIDKLYERLESCVDVTVGDW